MTTALFTAVFSDFEAGLKSFRLHRYLNRVETPAVMKWVKKFISSGAPATAESKPHGMELLPQAENQRLPLRVAFLGASGEKAEAVMYTSDREALTLETPKAQGTVTLSGKSIGPGSGLSFQKTFAFREDDYRIDADIKITNTSGARSAAMPLLNGPIPISRMPVKAAADFSAASLLKLIRLPSSPISSTAR